MKRQNIALRKRETHKTHMSIMLFMIGGIAVKDLVKINCYIQEYLNQAGDICARLRDKETDRIIILSGMNVDKDHLLMFLSQARVHRDMMPTVFDRDGSDIVAVRGYIVSDTSEEIEVCIDIETGGYLFK